MSIYLRELSHHSPAEHSLLAQQVAAPAAAAISQCSATAWDSSDEREEPLEPTSAAGPWWYLFCWVFLWLFDQSYMYFFGRLISVVLF